MSGRVPLLLLAGPHAVTVHRIQSHSGGSSSSLKVGSVLVTMSPADGAPGADCTASC